MTIYGTDYLETDSNNTYDTYTSDSGENYYKAGSIISKDREKLVEAVQKYRMNPTPLMALPRLPEDGFIRVL